MSKAGEAAPIKQNSFFCKTTSAYATSLAPHKACKKKRVAKEAAALRL
jgi:hypothetical protein